MQKSVSFSIRAAVSLFIAINLLVLALSGAVLFAAPPCSVAERIGWSFAGLFKSQWSAIHVFTAIAFVVFTLVHLFVYNWNPLVSYIKTGSSSKFPVTKEAWVAMFLAFLLFFAAASGFTPFRALMDYQESIKDSYRNRVKWEQKDESRRKGSEHLGRGQSNDQE